MSNPSAAPPPPPPLSTPSLGVTGRIFVITGGTQGLGLEIARQLKRKGAAAIVLVSRSPDKVQAALDQLDSGDDDGAGCIIKFVRADLSDAKEASSIVPQAIQLLSGEPSLPKHHDLRTGERGCNHIARKSAEYHSRHVR